MRFEVVGKDGQKTVLDERELCNLLTGKIISLPESDDAVVVAELALQLTALLERQGALRQSTPDSLAILAARYGYFLNTFLNKNKVTIANDKSTPGSSEGSEQPTSESSSS